jgi:hypothetical protein
VRRAKIAPLAPVTPKVIRFLREVVKLAIALDVSSRPRGSQGSENPDKGWYTERPSVQQSALSSNRTTFFKR